METTLRKATRLVSQLDTKIGELTQVLLQSTQKSVFVQDDLADITARLNTTLTEYRTTLDMVLRLYSARVTLRTLIGTTNETSGVNGLVTVLKGYEQKLSLLRSVASNAGDEPALSTRELGNRIAALASKNTKEVTIAAYRTREENDVAFKTLEKSDLDSLVSVSKEVAKKAETTHDQLERINNTVTVELPTEVVSVLTEAGVL